MSYRSTKRYLGETNLERKCRFLFGLALLVLILGSFTLHGMRTQEIVEEKNRNTAQHLVGVKLVYVHWEWWENDPEFKVLARNVMSELKSLDYQADILAVEPTGSDYVITPEGEAEQELLVELKQLYQQQLAEDRERLERADTVEDPLPGATPLEANPGRKLATLDELEPRFKEPDPQPAEEYYYYQPVYWKHSCRGCHFNPLQLGTVAAAQADGEDFPFRVVRVRIPHKETQQDVAKNWGILFLMAIVTTALAMAALFFIVKYVIVKPLQHLRDVSDEVSRGNVDVRADIHTNDEFEELADSFNRMLRHLVEAQEELKNVNNDLDGKVDQLARANMQLYEMNRLKSDFLATMSHELRTPLNSIIGFSDVLKEIDSLDAKQQRYVQNIQKSGRKLLEMINDILDLAKMEAGKMELRPSEFRIDAIVNAQCDMVRSLSEEKNIDLEVHVDAGGDPIYQDQSKVQQILTNLLSNAIKFTPEGGRIVVSAHRMPGSILELTVADTGVGIAQEDREVIFERFRQGAVQTGDNLTREYSGTGLGLSIVRELCKLLGGEIDFTSEVGVGSTFIVKLPWVLHERSQTASRVQRQLSELTRPQRGDFSAVGGNGHSSPNGSPNETS